MAKSKKIEDAVVFIAELCSAHEERMYEVTLEEIEKVLQDEGVSPEDFAAAADHFVDFVRTSEGWRLDEIRTILKALKRTPADLAVLGAKLLSS